MNNYQIGELIDKGGMGAVYRAHQTGLNRDVAIKFILESVASDPVLVERFLKEARLAARINHPNVVHIYDTGVDEHGRPFMVMELLHGEPLKKRLERGPMLESEAVEIAKQVLTALERAHAMDVVHRDIKPGNIYLCTDRLVKILDFGVAKGLDAGNVTMAGKTVGSPTYMSPEQAEGNVDYRSDLYSVGIVLYEMLTGSVPFNAENSFAIMQQHLTAPLPPLPKDVQPALRAIVEKALQKKPDQRFKNAAAMREALEKVQSRPIIVGQGAAARHHGAMKTPDRVNQVTRVEQPTTSRRSPVAAIVAVLAVFLVAGGAFALWPMIAGASATAGEPAPPANTNTNTVLNTDDRREPSPPIKDPEPSRNTNTNPAPKPKPDTPPVQPKPNPGPDKPQPTGVLTQKSGHTDAPIRFTRDVQYDSTKPTTWSSVLVRGRNGIRRTEYVDYFRDGKRIRREMGRSFVLREPVTQVEAKGTKVVVRDDPPPRDRYSTPWVCRNGHRNPNGRYCGQCDEVRN